MHLHVLYIQCSIHFCADKSNLVMILYIFKFLVVKNFFHIYQVFCLANLFLDTIFAHMVNAVNVCLHDKKF